MNTIIKQNKMLVFTSKPQTNPSNMNHKPNNQSHPSHKASLPNKPTVSINRTIHHHKTTKPSPEKAQDNDDSFSGKLKQFPIGVSQYQNSVLRNNNNILTSTVKAPRCIHVKKSTISNTPSHIEDNLLSPQLHIRCTTKPNQNIQLIYATNTSKPSRKQSIDKKKIMSIIPKQTMSQSSSSTKIKHVLNHNSNVRELKTILAKFSLVSHLTSLSKKRKQESSFTASVSNSGMNTRHNNTHVIANGNQMMMMTNEGNSMIYNETNGNEYSKISKGYIKGGTTHNSVISSQMKSYNNIKENTSQLNTFSHNDHRNHSHNNHSNSNNHTVMVSNYANVNEDKEGNSKAHRKIHHRNLKIESAFKSLKPIGTAFPSNIPLYQKDQWSTEVNHHHHHHNDNSHYHHNTNIFKPAITIPSKKHISHNKNPLKDNESSSLQKYTYQSKIYSINNRQKHLTANHSPIKSTPLNDINNPSTHNNDINDNDGDDTNSSTSIQESFIKESNYYQNESRKLSDYIIDYYSKNNGKYPKSILKFYKIGRAIGHGAFGKVNIGLHILTGKIVAIKSFNKHKKFYSKAKIEYEVKLMKKLRPHKCIVKLYEKIEGENYDCIIMENISGGNLLTLINKRSRLTEEIAKFIFRQLIETLKYVHSQGIAHRDIKPDNILIDLNNTVKLCDFGVAKEIQPGQLLRGICGTPAFVSPEILSDTPYDPFITDIWSSGVVLYSMLGGIFPFKGNNDYELHKSIINGSYADLPYISPKCKELISRILEVNPLKRISLDEILSHPWLSASNEKESLSYSLFTNAEKVIFSKLNIDYRKGKREDLNELFTYKNIDTSQENENQNVQSKSFINTPFNSCNRIIGRSYAGDNDDEEEVYYAELHIENKIVKYGPKVNELNRNYELNYNAEVDQGKAIQPKKNKVKRQLSSVHNSMEEVEIVKKHSSRKEKVKRNDSKDHRDTVSTNANTNTFYIDDSAVKIIEEFGFKRDYIMKSLENNDINHSTAIYYLLLSNSIE